MVDVIGFADFDRTTIADVGGKAAHLGELARLGGVRVPPGFCVTTQAFGRVVSARPDIAAHLDRLARLDPSDQVALTTAAAAIRDLIERVDVPDDLVTAIGEWLVRLGEQRPYAVRSSATAEDLPTASFAGQHDSYLNVVGRDAIVAHVRRCWASLFTDRAVTYRRRHGIDHRAVRMAVVVQPMLDPIAAGVLFTADPVTGNRTVSSVEAVAGLGEELVSGHTSADVYTVRAGAVVSVAARQPVPLMTTAQVLRLAGLGRRIEAHFGAPQDIEWCLVGDDIHIVQSRPITTLFPIPTTDDGAEHVFISVGHQQMMTDAMKPLGLSVWQLTTPRPMYEAGGRLFVDVAPALATADGRTSLLALAQSDPLVRDALQTILARREGGDALPDDRHSSPTAPTPVPTDPDLVTDLIAENRASVALLRQSIATLSGPALVEFIKADFAELRRILFDPRSHQVIMAGMEATWWLNDRLGRWLGEPNAASALVQSVPHNITSQMGLDLLDVADTIRPHEEVIAFLQAVVDEGRADAGFLDELAGLPGGIAARDGILDYLEAYGMRCAGEIDITRTRWSERPETLLPAILGNVANFAAGAGPRRFAQGVTDARHAAEDVLARLRALPDGEQKAAETAEVIDRVRALAGFREYPKYGMVSRYFVYKQALLRAAADLVASGVLAATDDIYYLRLDEVAEVVRTQTADRDLIRGRRAAFRYHATLVPPRVLTSDGEAITGQHRRDGVPPNALPGLAVSAGVIEGRARVVTDIAQARLSPGDILVTPFTDPSWTPLFLTAAAVVTEVGGLMTHGAVIAREYGLPGVVGVTGATRLIADGQRIRVDGTNGYVEILD